MGIIEINSSKGIITITSSIISYGNAADYEITWRISEEIERMWNDANGSILLNNRPYEVRFIIKAQYNSLIFPQSIIENKNPENNYIRIENYSSQNISCMDGIGCNTGYFLITNLYAGSTTAAHEYGHSLGLKHPEDLNYVGKGRPGIMYPRGTLVDAEFQYDVNAQPGGPGGTLNPQHRRVQQADIDNLKLPELIGKEIFVIGKFSNKYHELHEHVA